MKQTTVNVPELKARLSHSLRLAKAGEAVEITERGVPIARIVPIAAPVEDRLDAMARSGVLQWDGGGYRAPHPWHAPADRAVWPIC